MTLASGMPPLFLAASMSAVAHSVKLLAVLSVAFDAGDDEQIGVPARTAAWRQKTPAQTTAQKRRPATPTIGSELDAEEAPFGDQRASALIVG